jgi:ADP-ribosyl-[dinitrogen reductase] hydrolase
MERDYALDILLGLTVGDALGVPVEFLKRHVLEQNPVTTMIGGGMHRQIPGTWSDDGSLALCLADAMAKEPFTLKAIADNFEAWFDKAFWSARGTVFDVGIATQQAILEIKKNPTKPELSGGFDVRSNGNGSLMRILPLALFTHNLPVDERFIWTKNVSSITHMHIRSVMACFIYLELARHLLNGFELKEALQKVRQDLPEYFITQKQIVTEEVELFHRILNLKVGIYDVQPIETLSITEINSSGYVISTLEASIWCLLNTSNYKDAVLKAVNLGDDTDTTACVTGGLAGIMYGSNTIPAEWLKVLARRDDIEALGNKLNTKFKLP